MEPRFCWKKDKFDKRDYLHKRKFIELPGSINHSELLTPIRDQGSVGSCVGFGIGINFNSVKKNLAIFEEWSSPTYIYNGARYLEGTLLLDCGCYPRDALEWTVDYGILDEHFWPYDPSMVDRQAPSSERINQANRYVGFQYWRAVDGVDGLCDVLASGYLVSIGTPWFEEWRTTDVDGRLATPTANSTVAGGHETCLTKDTKISLLDGRECSIEQLLSEYSNKSFWVYSCDENQNIVPGRAHHVRYVGKKPVLRITLDNGEKIKCTSDHKFLLRNGEYKTAVNLNIGESLMPLYRKIKFDKYEAIMQLDTQKYELTHRLVASNLLKKSINKSNDRMIVHHKNFNSRDNTPENLEWMSWEDHTKKHQELISLVNKSDKARERSRRLMKKLWVDRPEMMYEKALRNAHKYRERASKEGKLGFQQKEKFNWDIMTAKTAEKIRGIKRSPEFCQHLSELKKQYWANLPIEIKAARMAALSASAAAKPVTERQREVRRQNMIRTNTARWNHVIISIEPAGVEDVYDLTVDKYHNIALSAGVFVHNCLYGYDRTAGVFLGVNSWGTGWGKEGHYIMPFESIEAFKNNGGYDGHYITFTPEIDDSPPPEPPTPSPCPFGNLGIVTGLAQRTGRFYVSYKNP